ncbi:uncharacterized protein [Apostichopus japonicus]|uniref:uncharacterized protein n=1 Tax=Stichopus japonicus TaxID=307972 RepID=UPI003AB6DC74
MGCSATKSSSVTSANNNNATETQQRNDQHGNHNGNLQNSAGKTEHGRHRKKLSPSLGHLASRSLPEDEISEGIDRETNPDGDGGDEVFAPDVKNGHAIRNEKSNGVKEKEDGNLVSNDEDAMTMAKKVPLSGPLYHGNIDFSRSQTDFFKMLDEKIARGQSLSSQESVR